MPERLNGTDDRFGDAIRNDPAARSSRAGRELPAGRVLDLLETSHGVASREAAALLTRDFTRLEEAVVSGLRVKDLLIPHFVRTRLRAPADAQRPIGAVMLRTGARADFESLRSRPVGVSLGAGILRPTPFSSSMGLRP